MAALRRGRRGDSGRTANSIQDRDEIWRRIRSNGDAERPWSIGTGADRLRVREPEGPQITERVNITVGPLSFDYADYDADNDVLYLHVGVPQPAEGEETPEGHVVRYAPGTSRVVGLTVLGAQHVLERDGRLAVTVP
jgi:hypothetical protein